MTAKEIAKELGLPESTVYWRIWYLRHYDVEKVSKPFNETTLELVRDFRTYKSGQKKKTVSRAKQGRFQTLLEQCGIADVSIDALDSLAVSLGYKQAGNLYDRLHYAEQLLQRQITDPEEFQKYVLAGKESPFYQDLKDQKLQQTLFGLPVRGLKLQHLENLINSLNVKESKEWQELRKDCHCNYKSIRTNYVIAVLEYALQHKWIDHEKYWKMRDSAEERDLRKRR